MMRKRIASGIKVTHAVAPVIALVLLLTLPHLLVTETRFSDDIVARNARIRQAFDEVPWNVGRWRGVEVPFPVAADSILNPNAVITRKYREVGTARAVTLLIVHCSDIRDLLGHYPPVCYPNAGWITNAQEFIEVDAADSLMDGAVFCRYRFSKSLDLGDHDSMRVLNFFILPDGSLATDMNELKRLAGSSRSTVLGAAQVQLVCDPSINAGDDVAVFHDLLDGLNDLFRELGMEVLSP